VASLLSKTVLATKAAIAAFRESFTDPARAQIEFVDRQSYFNLLWAYYKNSAFDDITAWSQYRQTYTLYRNIRSIYNPTKRLVNFYVSQVYPGVLSEDAERLPDGVQLAIPLSDDTPDSLKTAIAQFWQWTNWQSGNRLMVRYGAATGSSLVEVVDAVDRGKVSAAIRWPGLVADLELDDVGNVKAYALEYQTVDADGKEFTYRKEVDQLEFRYFRDEAQTGSDPNPYGFVPAVWCKHVDEGSDYGAPAIAGSIAKIDELNGLASHTNDHIDLLVDSPGVISADGPVGKIEQQAADKKRLEQDEFSALSSVREKPTRRLLLKASKGATWVPLTGNLQPDQVVPHMEKLIGEIEHDFPELSMYQELRKMSQVTGPGAARMMGDVGNKVLEVASNYDTQSIKLFQMAVAIGGFRFREGREGWSLKTDAQRKFAPFGLESYAQGDLDFAITPRPLIPLTEVDAVELTGKRLDNAGKASRILNDDKTLEIAGITDKAERAQIINQKKQESQEAAALIQSQPNGGSEFVQ